MAAAARELGLVPSAMSYRVRQMEQALDVLLFDRSRRNARLTAAGQELLTAGSRVLDSLDALALRVKRVATGWEPSLTIAIDSLISQDVMFELCEQFLAIRAPTRIRLLSETLSGTWEALATGRADLMLGGVAEDNSSIDYTVRPLGEVSFVFAVAPRHPLAKAQEPLPDTLIVQQLAIAVADSSSKGPGLSVGLLAGQPVFTVPNMPAKLSAQLRGLGCGFLPECLAGPYVESGRLIAKSTERPPRTSRVSYAWRSNARHGLALKWWIKQLASAATRQALLDFRGRQQR